jgi:hypothetical protein
MGSLFILGNEPLTGDSNRLPSPLNVWCHPRIQPSKKLRRPMLPRFTGERIVRFRLKPVNHEKILIT